MTTKWVGFAGQTIVAFLATFAGVFSAQTLANNAERDRQLEQFNSTFAIMGQDCERALARLRATSLEGVVDDYALGPPTFTWWNAYNHGVILNQIDAQRMSKLVEQIRKVDDSYYKLTAFNSQFRWPLKPAQFSSPRPDPPKFHLNKIRASRLKIGAFFSMISIPLCRQKKQGLMSTLQAMHQTWTTHALSSLNSWRSADQRSSWQAAN